MTVLYTDSFPGADANPIGGNWTTVTGYGDMQRLSNKLLGGSGSDNAAYVNTVTPANDQYAQAIVTMANGDGGPIVRTSTSATDFYVLDVVSGNPVQIFKVINAVFTFLLVGATAGDGDACYLSVQGTTVEAKLNGASQGTVPDSALTSGRFGVFMFGGTLALKWDNFEGGDFLTPSGGLPLLGVGD